MPKECKGIFDNQTGLWLTGVTNPPLSFQWGSASNALCLTSEQIALFLSQLSDNARYGEGAVTPTKGF